MIKLVVTDLDGTFLDDRKNISDQNKRAVQKLQENNIDFCICTGRLYSFAKLISKEVGNDFPIISCNGAFIKDPKTNENIFNSSIDPEISVEISKRLEKYDIVYHFYNEDTVFSNKMERNAKAFHDKFRNETKKPIQVVLSDNLKLQIPHAGFVNKFILFTPDSGVKRKIIQELSHVKDIDITQSGDDNIEIMAKGISKGFGIKKLREKMGLLKEEIMVLGDQYNDLSMFSEALYSVAMDNAAEELKKKAFFTTLSNTQSGFAYAVERLIFKKGDEIVYR